MVLARVTVVVASVAWVRAWALLATLRYQSLLLCSRWRPHQKRNIATTWCCLMQAQAVLLVAQAVARNVRPIHCTVKMHQAPPPVRTVPGCHLNTFASSCRRQDFVPMVVSRFWGLKKSWHRPPPHNCHQRDLRERSRAVAAAGRHESIRCCP